MTIFTAAGIARQQHINLARQGKVDARDFLQSKAVKRLLGEDYTPAISQVEVESEGQVSID